MKLNYDCLRDVLLSLESHLELDDLLAFQCYSFEDILNFKDLQNYSDKDIFYAIYNLKQIDFINCSILYSDGGTPRKVLISNINYSGHEFLETIKSDTIWKTLKEKFSFGGGMSLPIIQDVATALILKKIGI